MSVRPRSGIRSWEGWPDDVRETIRHWNKQRKLAFVQPRSMRLFGIRVFMCGNCRQPFRPQATVCAWRDAGVVRRFDWREGDVVEKGELWCDYCVIDLARQTATARTSAVAPKDDSLTTSQSEGV